MKNGMITSSAIVIVILGIRIGFVWAKSNCLVLLSKIAKCGV